MWLSRNLALLIGALGWGLAAGEQCPGPTQNQKARSQLTNTMFINLVPQNGLYYQIFINAALQANISFEQWQRGPINNSIFAPLPSGSITINNPYPSWPIQRAGCLAQQTLVWPNTTNLFPGSITNMGFCGFQNGKSNLVAMVPAQANSGAVSCQWVTVQISPNTTVPDTSLRIATASFVTPINSTYQTPIAFQMYCTDITTQVSSWSATALPGFQQRIPVVGCTNAVQGCFHVESYWSMANYTAMLTVGLDDPAGSGSKVRCSRIRAVDLSNNNATIGQPFTLPSWKSSFAGSTVLLAVYGNESSSDSTFRRLKMSNFWTFGDVCNGTGPASIQLLPPPPPPPQNVPEELGWSVVYMVVFVVVSCIVGASCRGCRSGTGGSGSGGGVAKPKKTKKNKFEPMENTVQEDED